MDGHSAEVRRCNNPIRIGQRCRHVEQWVRLDKRSSVSYSVRMRGSLPGLISSLLLAASCPGGQPAPGSAGPVEAVQDFAESLGRGDAVAAWALLSARTQQEADARAKAAREASGGVGPASGRQMLFASAVRTGTIHAREVSRSGDSAEVETTSADGGARSGFHVVRENGTWKVDLPLGKP